MAKRVGKDIAVVIPFYNEADSLVHTLASFDNSHFLAKSSFFLVNNNSSDHTEQYVREFAKTHPEYDIHIVSESHQGIPHARKRGLDSVPLEYQFMVSTDSDTLFNEAAQLELLSLIDGEEWDVLVGKGSIPSEHTLLRLVHFPDFVRLSRALWKIEQDLFGGYFFGGYFAIKTRFYKTIQPYFDIETSPIIHQGGSEDLLLSRRAYYADGRFQNVSQPVLTSGRRFMGNPLQWILSEREVDFRSETDEINQELLDYVAGHHDELIKKRIINTSQKWLKSLADAWFFWQVSQQQYDRPLVAFQKANQVLQIKWAAEDPQKVRAEFKTAQQLADHLVATHTELVAQVVENMIQPSV